MAKRRKESIEHLQRKLQKLQQEIDAQLEVQMNEQEEENSPSETESSKESSGSGKEQTDADDDETSKENVDSNNKPLTAKTPEEAVLKKSEAHVKLDDETLSILGTDEGSNNSKNFDFHPDLAKTWERVLIDGLKKVELLDKYPRVGNCPILTSKLNPEIEASINDTAKKRDAFFVIDQELCGAGISALGTGLSMIFNSQVEEIDTIKLLTTLADAGKLFCELHSQLTKARKAYLYPNLDKKAKALLQSTKTGEFLFGSELSSKIKTAKAVEKVGLTLKSTKNENKTVFKASGSLNWKGPFRGTRGQAQAGYKNMGSQRSYKAPYNKNRRNSQQGSNYQMTAQSKNPTEKK